MSTERVVVRMSRSDPSIPWALTFSNRGGDVIISSVTPDGLSCKAGVLSNDTVVEVCGRRVSRDEAQRLMGESRLDVDMVLSRVVTSHTCLPWNLTEKGNEVFVDHIDSKLRNAFNQDHGRSQITSASSNSSWNHPTFNQGNQNYSTRNESSNYASSKTTSSNPAPIGGSSTFHSSTHNTSSRAPFTTSIPITTTHSYSTGAPTNGGYGGAGYGSQTTTHTTSNNNNYNAAPAKFGSGVGGQNVNSGYSNGGPKTGGDYSSSHSIPLNQNTYIDTSSSNQRGRESTLSPNRVFYHSPSSRVRRDLSPGSSIHHLQYNSPMNLYSTETAAEEYSNQTGQPTDGRVGSKSPAYLNSETRRLIEAQERGGLRGPSPSNQSPCFGRISHAVHADY